ncbi:BgTH12-06585 [Blumeria graminis f. sp. triticale]|uniref:4-hydroxybenzoate polyprenyltransferase, mitochondrial n=1 Tax=Blumeria graminis f. sp. triticale TaxID=1689686 RepID=A0A9W4CYL4_BLUGR|nr:BgTH12-06585 [Blumeria graminis f. sp. triticale]
MANCRPFHSTRLREAMYQVRDSYFVTRSCCHAVNPHKPKITAIFIAKQSIILDRSKKPPVPSLLSANLTLRAYTKYSSSPLIPAPYQTPKTGLLSRLPPSWVPYAELIRIDKPTGTYYLFFPCIFSTLLAAPLVVPHPSPSSVLQTSLLFFAGALVMRGAGCTINDLWDRNLDPHVSRTRLRPIARKSVSPLKALAFTGTQLLTGLGILLQFPEQCLFYGIPSLILVVTYPLAKRYTHYPQLVLGLTFSWGAIMGFPALGVDLMQNMPALTAASFLYASNIAWTIIYDMIYAHLDIKDDAKAGIKSIALRHDQWAKQILSALAILQVGSLTAAGVATGAGPAFFIGSCGGSAASLAIMIKRINLKSVDDCWWWFVNGCWITGGVISGGMVIDYLARYFKHKNLISHEGKKDNQYNCIQE